MTKERPKRLFDSQNSLIAQEIFAGNKQQGPSLYTEEQLFVPCRNRFLCYFFPSKISMFSSSLLFLMRNRLLCCLMQVLLTFSSKSFNNLLRICICLL